MTLITPRVLALVAGLMLAGGSTVAQSDQPSDEVVLFDENGWLVNELVLNNVVVCNLLKGFAKNIGIVLRYQLETRDLWVLFVKAGWDIPSKTQISVLLDVNRSADWHLDGVSGESRNTVYAKLGSRAVPFLKAISAEGEMHVGFIGGNEPVWNVPLSGVSAALDHFAQCIQNNMLDENPTQPYAR